MSGSIEAVRDGIAGSWDQGAFTTVFPQRPADDIQYARREVRGLLLGHAMVETVAVKPERTGRVVTGATVLMRDDVPRTLFTTERPRLGSAENDADTGVYPLAPQTDLVRLYADLRPDRLTEINLQIDDMLSFFGAIHYLDDQRRMKSLEILQAGVRFAIYVEMMVKHFCFTPRPIDVSPQLQPIVQTPDHSSFPSGHATEAFLTATLMYRLSTGKTARAGIAEGAQEFRLAQRIAANRTVAGVHFPMDSAAGAVMGCVLGTHLWDQSLGQAGAQDASFALVNGTTQEMGKFGAEQDFTLDWLLAQLPEDDAGSIAEPPRFADTILGAAMELAWAEWPR